MKNILILLTVLFFASCEKVIEADLNTAAPRLVIDAAIKWQKGTTGNQQTIKLTTTTGYYKSQIPVVLGAIVKVTNSTNTVFDFTETPNTGIYVCTNFVPVLGETYSLKVTYGGQTYTATETLINAPSIINVEQRNDLGLNSDEIGIKVNFKDLPNNNDFYLVTYQTPVLAFPFLEVFNDEFFEGNIIFGLFSNKDLKTGNQIKIELNGVSKPYFNYLTILTGIANGSGGPFGTVPATTLRGNFTNTINKQNYALGYFSLSQTDNLIYTTK